MKFNALATSLEDSRSALSKAKSTLEKISSSLLPADNKITEEQVLNFEEAINNTSKAIIKAYDRIKFKVPYMKYSVKDNNTYLRVAIAFKVGVVPVNEISKVVGELNLIKSNLTAFLEENIAPVVDGKTNTKVTFTKTFFKHIQSTIDYIDSLITSISERYLGVTEE